MMIVHWEVAPLEAAPIVAYRVYISRLRVQKTRQAEQMNDEQDTFDGYDALETIERTMEFIDYPIHLPYTHDMLLRRAANGQDVPEFIQLKGVQNGV